MSAVAPGVGRRFSAIDVYVHLFDAGLPRLVASAGTPRAIITAGIVHLRQKETAPLALADRPRRAFSAELKGEHFLLSFRVAENVRADLAVPPAIDERHLLAPENGFAKDPVDGARHGEAIGRFRLFVGH